MEGTLLEPRRDGCKNDGGFLSLPQSEIHEVVTSTFGRPMWMTCLGEFSGFLGDVKVSSNPSVVYCLSMPEIDDTTVIESRE